MRYAVHHFLQHSFFDAYHVKVKHHYWMCLLEDFSPKYSMSSFDLLLDILNCPLYKRTYGFWELCAWYFCWRANGGTKSMGYSRYARLHHIWSFQTRTPDLNFVGQEEFDRLRSLSYAETHVIMICFSVDNPISLENVESKVDHLPPFPTFLDNWSAWQWLDEILEYCPGVKVC
jgi:hypothetical protein